MKPLGGKPLKLSNDAIFNVASFLKMPGEQHEDKSLENFRMVCKRFNLVVKSKRRLLQHQWIRHLFIQIDIVSSLSKV